MAILPYNVYRRDSQGLILGSRANRSALTLMRAQLVLANGRVVEIDAQTAASQGRAAGDQPALLLDQRLIGVLRHHRRLELPRTYAELAHDRGNARRPAHQQAERNGGVSVVMICWRCC